MSEERSDELLMKAYLSGDSAAFEALYRRYSARVYSYLNARVSSRAEVDEIFQSIFLKLHRSRSRFDFKYTFAQWLFVIARTTLLDFLRKSGRQVPLEQSVPFDEILETQVSQTSPEVTLESLKEIEILEDLPREQRLAVEMRVIEEMSYEQIALKLNSSQANIRQMVSRALRRLRSAR